MQCLHRANQGLRHAGNREGQGRVMYGTCHSRVPLPPWPCRVSPGGFCWGRDAAVPGCDGSRLAVPLLLRSACARIQAHTRCFFPACVARECCPSPGMQRYIYGKGLELRLELRSRPKSGEGSTRGDRCASGLSPGAQHWPFHRVPDTYPGWAREMP